MRRPPSLTLVQRGPFAASIALAVALFAPRAEAQQSLFNAPAGHSTARGRFFGQQQFSLTPSAGESNTTLQVGLTDGIEVGVNVLHVPLYVLGAHAAPEGGHARATAESSVHGNVSTTVTPTSYLSIQGGVALGAGAHPHTRSPELSGYAWAVTHWTAPGRWGSYVAGLYAGTRGALGAGPGMGVLLGVELPVWPERFHLMADWVLGLNAISVAVAGVNVFFGPNFQLSGGVQLPSPGSQNDFGGVLELTWVPEEWTTVHSAHEGPSPHAGHAHEREGHRDEHERAREEGHDHHHHH